MPILRVLSVVLACVLTVQRARVTKVEAPVDAVKALYRVTEVFTDAAFGTLKVKYANRRRRSASRMKCVCASLLLQAAASGRANPGLSVRA